MSAKPCRDCGYMLEPKMRGCPQCAMNLEAENRIERFLWRRMIPGVIIVALSVVAAIIYVMR
jgi:RNA polymerase subunit RPABC4/transcription elongation factor Spt4